jgi:hypothetical protein
VTVALGAAALLLLVAGAAKVADPTTTAGALAALGWPSSVGSVRLGAGVEALLGAAALVVGGPVLAALVGVSYLAFSGFLVAALRAGTPLSSCGCFGRADTPAHPVHVVVDAALAAGALAAAVAGADPLVDAALPAVAGSLVFAAAAYAVLTRPLGRARTAVR